MHRLLRGLLDLAAWIVIGGLVAAAIAGHQAFRDWIDP